MPNSYLEEEFAEPYTTWKTAKTPAANATFLQTLQPTIDQGIRMHVGEPNPLITSRARQISLKAIGSYDPTRSRLKTHLFNQLQGLKRINRQQSQIIHMPERLAMDAYHLANYTQELNDELGREPTDVELANRTGFSRRRIGQIRGMRPGVAEGTLTTMLPDSTVGIRPDNKAQSMWVELIHDDLEPVDQLILEHTLGLHGKPVLSNQAIARKLGRSPGAISQHKLRIQQLLNQEQNLSPFIQ